MISDRNTLPMFKTGGWSIGLHCCSAKQAGSFRIIFVHHILDRGLNFKFFECLTVNTLPSSGAIRSAVPK
jgi:hypothetical protein